MSLLQILNQKGQDIVEYAILLAFCAVIGYGAHSLGFFSLLDDNYSKTAEVAFMPSDIKPLETNVSGNVAAVMEFDLSTPAGRLAADKAKIKKLGESLAAHFKKNNVKDDFTKADSPVELDGDYISILVLPDGSLNIYCAANGKKWLTELDQNSTTYKNYVAALKDVGIDLSNSYISDTVVRNSKNKDMGKTQYYTDTNFKLYSSGDEGGLNNGYAISFTKLNNEMQLKYYELNNPYTKEDLGTMYVPRSWLATGESNNKVSDDGKDKYPNKQTVDLSVD